MEQKKRYWSLAGTFLIFTIIIAGILFISSLQKPETVLEEVGATITLHGIDVVFSLAIHNPNLISLTIKDFHAIAIANGVPLTEAIVPQIYLPAGETVHRQITVSLGYADLGAAFVSALRERSITWRASGGYTVVLPLGFEKPYTFSIVR